MYIEELLREISPEHILNGIDVSLVAIRKDCDDVLFALNDGSSRFAVVHLTWSGKRETNLKSPGTRIFADFQLWLEYMNATHKAFAEPDIDGQLWLNKQEVWNRSDYSEQD
jgi:hypothetical protein